MHIRLKNKFLYFYNYKIKCSIGKRGLTYQKKEGDLKTPKGKFKFRFLLYRKDRVKKVNTNLKKMIISKKMGWCDDPRSNKYNKMIKFPFAYSAEKLYLKKKIYDLILVTNFNSKPVIKKKGSAIFVHLSEKGFKSTKGCIGIKKSDFLEILPLVTKKTLLIVS